jgi:hypothetical protein
MKGFTICFLRENVILIVKSRRVREAVHIASTAEILYSVQSLETKSS